MRFGFVAAGCFVLKIDVGAVVSLGASVALLICVCALRKCSLS